MISFMKVFGGEFRQKPDQEGKGEKGVQQGTGKRGLPFAFFQFSLESRGLAE
jgi:hypothetical protein